MRGNRRSGTRPELRVRRLLHRLGYRYRTQLRGVAGRPDIAFPGRKQAIQVHGCFWHQHPDSACKLSVRPRSNTGYWDLKLARNLARDAEQAAQQEAAGWKVLVIWECECADEPGLVERLTRFLGPTRVSGPSSHPS